MDNQQFRRLVLDTPKQQHEPANKSPGGTRTPSTVLGARLRSSIPMTPRQVSRSSVQADFARQLIERNAKANPQKTFRSSAPKGTRLVAGYTDRTKERADEEQDEKAQRIKNLEESMREGQIDRETFEKLVQEITGGDIGSTHLVKGLDRKLLERVRRGEDVFGGIAEAGAAQSEPVVEDEFDQLAQQEVGPIVREKVEKKGQLAWPSPAAGVKRKRAELLAELKQKRAEAATAAAAEHEKKYPTLGPGFRKLNAPGMSRIEIDAKGREVLIVVDAEGKEKRKVRKQKVEESLPQETGGSDEHGKTRSIMQGSLPPKPTEESGDEDIFEGVGSNYNPLAGLENDDDSSSEEDGETKPSDSRYDNPNAERLPQQTAKKLYKAEPSHVPYDKTIPHSSPRSSASSEPLHTKRDYFKSSSRTFTVKETPAMSSVSSESSTADATVRAALHKVRTMDPNSTLLNVPESQEERLKKRAAELAARDRDMEDLDMGFGSSRFDDAEEMEREEEKIKFSEWKGLGAGGDEDEVHGERGGKQRKRGPKRRKGDKNNASDVLKAMERQREKKLG